MARKVPPVTGQLTIDTYDLELVACATDFARELEIPLSLFIHDALKHHLDMKRRLVEWKRKQDEQDPDLREIRGFLDEFASDAPHGSHAE